MKTAKLLAALAAGIALICFDLYKASHASFTHDEGYSYMHYVPMDILDITSYKDNFTNNHILNSLFMKLFNFLFGNSELSLRMPNILFHVLYIFFTYKTAVRFCGKQAFFVFILLNANPFLIDFFSLARGYGMAAALLSGGLYYSFRYIESGQSRHQLLSLSFIAVGTLANFALLNLFLLLILLQNFFHFVLNRQCFSAKAFWDLNKVNLFAAVLLGAVLYEPMRKIIKYNLLNFGGTTGFWQDTVISLSDASNYYSAYGNQFRVAVYLLIGISGALFLLFLLRLAARRTALMLPQKLALFACLLISLFTAGSILQHAVLGTPFLMSRFALFLVPLFLWACVLLLQELLSVSSKLPLKVPLPLLSFAFLLHTLLSLNTSAYYEWQYDKNTRAMMEKLHEARPGPLTLSCFWLFEPSINYYIQKLGMEAPRVERRSSPPVEEFTYMRYEDTAAFPGMNQRYSPQMEFENTGTVLWKLKDPMPQ